MKITITTTINNNNNNNNNNSNDNKWHTRMTQHKILGHKYRN